MIQMYLLTEHKEINRLTEQMCDCCGGRDSQGVWDGRVHTATFNTENQQGCTLQHMLQCYAAAWMGGEFGGEQIHAYVWLRLFAVLLKLSQHCSSAILQNKIKRFCFIFLNCTGKNSLERKVKDKTSGEDCSWEREGGNSSQKSFRNSRNLFLSWVQVKCTGLLGTLSSSF